MNGAGSAYARPSRRRKFLPPRSGSRASSSAGMNIADRMRSQGSGAGARFALEARQEVEPLLVHRIEAPREHRLEQLFLAAEVIVDRREVDAGGGGDRAQARRLEAVLHEERLRGVQDPLLGRRRAARESDRNNLCSHRFDFSPNRGA